MQAVVDGSKFSNTISHRICTHTHKETMVSELHWYSRQLSYHSISSNWIILSQPTIGLKAPFMGSYPQIF